jgi:FkbM family methyltransferase
MRSVTLDDGRRAWCLQRYEAHIVDREVRDYLRYAAPLAPGDVVLDVGANIGLFALRVLQESHGKAQIYCVEPVPDIRAVLARNLAGTSACILPWAVDSAGGTIDIDYFPRSPATSTAHRDLGERDWEKVVRDEAHADPRFGRFARLVPGLVFRAVAGYLHAGRRTVRCESRTLSEVIDAYSLERIALLKVDVEGSELGALRGLRDEHWPRVQQVVAEVHERHRDLSTIERRLARFGLRIVRVAPAEDSGPCTCCTVWAARPS